MASNRKKIVVTVVSVLLALVFLAAGLPKLAGVEMQVESFKIWGYPPYAGAPRFVMRGTRASEPAVW